MIPDMEDGVAHTFILNGLKSRGFKFSLAEQKETTLAKALRKVADFIRATEICTDNSDAPKKVRIPMDKNPNRGDRNHSPRDRRSQLEVVDPRFTTDLKSIQVEVRGHPMLQRPPPMTTPPKPHNARKCCKFHKQNAHTKAECHELKKVLHELADKG